MSRFALALMLLTLAACQRPPGDGAANADQATQLDNAETLDASPDGLSAPAEGNASNVTEMDD